MKKIFVLPGLLLLATTLAHADSLTKNAQAELKNEGFFYGEVDGNLTTETSASLKRYQIRNGLEVTGTLTRQTLESLGLAGKTSPPAGQPPPVSAEPPVNLRRGETVTESDRQFLRREEQAEPPASAPPAPPDESRTSPSAPPPMAPGGNYAALFSRTPFATAPEQVQRKTVSDAQRLLARDGIFRERIDGAPSGDLEQALLGYQQRNRLPLTGRLDLETLSRMRLLPGRGGPPLQPFYGDRREKAAPKVYRGIWVD